MSALACARRWAAIKQRGPATHRSPTPLHLTVRDTLRAVCASAAVHVLACILRQFQRMLRCMHTRAPAPSQQSACSAVPDSPATNTPPNCLLYYTAFLLLHLLALPCSGTDTPIQTRWQAGSADAAGQQGSLPVQSGARSNPTPPSSPEPRTPGPVACHGAPEDPRPSTRSARGRACSRAGLLALARAALARGGDGRAVLRARLDRSRGRRSPPRGCARAGLAALRGPVSPYTAGRDPPRQPSIPVPGQVLSMQRSADSAQQQATTADAGCCCLHCARAGSRWVPRLTCMTTPRPTAGRARHKRDGERKQEPRHAPAATGDHHGLL